MIYTTIIEGMENIEFFGYIALGICLYYLLKKAVLGALGAYYDKIFKKSADSIIDSVGKNPTGEPYIKEIKYTVLDNEGHYKIQIWTGQTILFKDAKKFEEYLHSLTILAKSINTLNQMESNNEAQESVDSLLNTLGIKIEEDEDEDEDN